MVKINILLSVLFITLAPTRISAQDALYQAWVLTKVEMMDSSSVINHNSRIDAYLRFEFDRTRMFRSSSSPIEMGSSFSYLIHGSEINVYTTINTSRKFEIQKLNQDSLILIEEMENMPADKIKRFYFRPEKKIIKESLTTLNDSIVASAKISPKLRESFSYLMQDYLSDFQGKGTVSGKFFVSNQSMVVKIDKTEGLKSNKITMLTQALKKLENQWVLPETGRTPVYIIEFYLDLEVKNSYGHRYNALGELSISKSQASFIYITPFTQKKPTEDILSLKTLELIDAHYKNGVTSFSAANYDSAIQEFDACLNLYPNHLDARYLRAYTYFKLSKLTEACSDISFLAALNQKTAIQLQKEYCK